MGHAESSEPQIQKTPGEVSIHFPKGGNLRAREKALRKALQNADLITVQLTDQQITGPETEQIGRLLEDNRYVENVYLAWNRVGDIGALAFAKALSVNTSIRVLDLGSNGIHNNGAESLAVAMEANPKLALQELRLANNFIENAGAQCLLDAIQDNSTLSLLDLEDNCIDDDLMEKVRAIGERPAFKGFSYEKFGKDMLFEPEDESGKPQPFRVGAQVVITGLTQGTQYNGFTGYISRILDDNRVCVKITFEGAPKTLALQLFNIRRATSNDSDTPTPLSVLSPSLTPSTAVLFSSLTPVRSASGTPIAAPAPSTPTVAAAPPTLTATPRTATAAPTTPVAASASSSPSPIPAVLFITCPSCPAKLPSFALFCGDCGTPLTPSQGQASKPPQVAATSASAPVASPSSSPSSIASPSIASPSIASPSIASPSIASPSIASPPIASPSIASPSASIATPTTQAPTAADTVTPTAAASVNAIRATATSATTTATPSAATTTATPSATTANATAANATAESISAKAATTPPSRVEGAAASNKSEANSNRISHPVSKTTEPPKETVRPKVEVSATKGDEPSGDKQAKPVNLPKAQAEDVAQQPPVLSLVECIRLMLNNDEAAVKGFMDISVQFRKGQISGKDYYRAMVDTFAPAQVLELVPRLLSALASNPERLALYEELKSLHARVYKKLIKAANELPVTEDTAKDTESSKDTKARTDGNEVNSRSRFGSSCSEVSSRSRTGSSNSESSSRSRAGSSNSETSSRSRTGSSNSEASWTGHESVSAEVESRSHDDVNSRRRIGSVEKAMSKRHQEKLAEEAQQQPSQQPQQPPQQQQQQSQPQQKYWREEVWTNDSIKIAPVPSSSDSQRPKTSKASDKGSSGSGSGSTTDKRTRVDSESGKPKSKVDSSRRDSASEESVKVKAAPPHKGSLKQEKRDRTKSEHVKGSESGSSSCGNTNSGNTGSNTNSNSSSSGISANSSNGSNSNSESASGNAASPLPSFPTNMAPPPIRTPPVIRKGILKPPPTKPSADSDFSSSFSDTDSGFSDSEEDASDKTTRHSHHHHHQTKGSTQSRSSYSGVGEGREGAVPAAWREAVWGAEPTSSVKKNPTSAAPSPVPTATAPSSSASSFSSFGASTTSSSSASPCPSSSTSSSSSAFFSPSSAPTYYYSTDLPDDSAPAAPTPSKARAMDSPAVNKEEAEKALEAKRNAEREKANEIRSQATARNAEALQEARKQKQEELERRQKDRVKELRKNAKAQAEDMEIRSEARGLVGATVREWAAKYAKAEKTSYGAASKKKKPSPDIVQLLLNVHTIFPPQAGEKYDFTQMLTTPPGTTVSSAVVKRAYLRACIAVHPDKHNHDKQILAGEVFEVLRESYKAYAEEHGKS